MPFIDSKITVSLTPEKEEAIKAKLGEAIQILNKSETYLMVGFEDNYDLYMGGSNFRRRINSNKRFFANGFQFFRSNIYVPQLLCTVERHFPD